MKKELQIRIIEIAAYILLALVTILGFRMASKGEEAFMHFLREDGLVENLTVVFLLVSCVIALVRTYGYSRQKELRAVVFWSFTAFMFFFAAGEEISWGQRIFGLESPEFFMERNLQYETNLHNLEIGGVKINKLIFSQLLFAVMVFYLILLRPLSQKFSFFRNQVTAFQVPLARWGYVVIMIVLAFSFSQINILKKSELIEFTFSVIFLLIFLNPILLRMVSKRSAQG